MRTILHAAAALLTLSGSIAQAGTADLFVFGDSLNDSGNARLLLEAGGGKWNETVYPKSQFTSGDTWATQLGVKPSLLGGTNFSYGGARAARNKDPIPDLMPQIRSFKQSGLSVDQNSTAAIWVGGNDFLALDDDASQKVFERTIKRTINRISRGVRKLSQMGVGNILVLGLPDFGSLPGNAGDPQAAAEASFLTGIYNMRLSNKLSRLDTRLATNLGYFDTNSLFQQVLASVPSDLMSVPCLAQPADCALNPENYVFYDDIHPSAWVHSLLADAIAEEIKHKTVAAVPLPATAPLILVGLGGLALLARRRKSRA